MKLFIDALKRTAALIASQVAALVASGAIMGIETWKTAIQTALAAALTIWGAIGRSYYQDGKLTRDEVDKAFK